VRIAFPPASTTDDALNGAWWPRTREPETELPGLVAAVVDRLGVVHRISLNADDWNSWPHRLVIVGGPGVQLNWRTGDAHTATLTGGDIWHLDLLAIPPDTPTVLALACLARAVRDMSHPAGPGGTAACSGHRAGPPTTPFEQETDRGTHYPTSVAPAINITRQGCLDTFGNSVRTRWTTQ